MKRSRLNELLHTEDAQLQKLNRIVLEAIEEEKLLSQKLHQFDEGDITFSSRLADKVASFGGSWKFIVSFLFFMLLWMMVNVYLLTKPFDAFPFILLNLILSSIAAIQAPIIMMSQNRKEEKDRQRAINDYLVNLKAEIEIRNMHSKLDLLIAEQMKNLFELQKAQLDMLIDINQKISSYQKAKLI
jgi:uncharacterized membrane protein